MGRALRKLTLLACGASLLWVAAPALSSTPYLPPAADFSQPLTGVEQVAATKAGAAPGNGPVTHRSGTIAAPARFDLVGIAGERRPVEIRARQEGGEWSEWVEVANGDPLYVGGADASQLRARGWRPEGRLHYVNVSGTTSAAQTALTGIRGAISTAFVGVSNAITPEAGAAVAKPSFVSREGWGAERDQGGCQPRSRPAYGKVKAAAVHHTVTANDYSPSEARGIVLGICRFHRNGNGWNDIGYNALVDRFGTLYAGREGGLDRAVVGAQAQGYNSTTAGISVIGNHSSVRAPKRAIDGLTHYLAWKLRTHGRPAKGKTTVISQGGDANRYPQGKKVRIHRIYAHGTVDYTECPGGQLRSQLRVIRDRTDRRMQH